MTASIWVWVAVISSAIVISSAVKLSIAYHKQHAIIVNNYFYVNELGGFLPNSMGELISNAREMKGKTVGGEYFNIFSSMNRNFAKLPTDSVIHAFGSVRERYINDFKNNPPDIYLTTLRSFSDWQIWSTEMNWWMYEMLIQNYDIIQIKSPTTVVWKYKGYMPLINDNTTCSVDNSNNSISLQNARNNAYYSVKINYDYGELDRRSLIFIEVSDERTAVLNRSKNTTTLPIFSNNKDTFKAYIRSVNNDIISEFKLLSCTALLVENDMILR